MNDDDNTVIPDIHLDKVAYLAANLWRPSGSVQSEETQPAVISSGGTLQGNLWPPVRPESLKEMVITMASVMYRRGRSIQDQAYPSQADVRDLFTMVNHVGIRYQPETETERRYAETS